MVSSFHTQHAGMVICHFTNKVAGHPIKFQCSICDIFIVKKQFVWNSDLPEYPVLCPVALTLQASEAGD